MFKRRRSRRLRVHMPNRDLGEKRSMKAHPLVLVLIGMMLAIISGLFYLGQKNLAENGVETIGKTVDYKEVVTEKEDSDGYYYEEISYQAVIEYTDGSGDAHRFTASTHLQSPGIVGSPITVVYDPKKPSTAATASSLKNNFILLIFVVIGVIIAIGGAFLWMRKRNASPKVAEPIGGSAVPPTPPPSPLDDYVANARSSGQDDVTIHAALLGSGWQEADITKAITHTPKK